MDDLQVNITGWPKGPLRYFEPLGPVLGMVARGGFFQPPGTSQNFRMEYPRAGP
jgi:hypothetical protein